MSVYCDYVREKKIAAIHNRSCIIFCFEAFLRAALKMITTYLKIGYSETDLCYMFILYQLVNPKRDI